MEKRYFITDASKMVDVEAHVLRYWEEELMIDIPRNEMGHRYYTDYHVELMKKVKELKSEGFQLKAIKNLLPELKVSVQNEVKNGCHDAKMTDVVNTPVNCQASNTPMPNQSQVDASMSKIEQFQLIIGQVVTKALADNNVLLEKNVTTQVSDKVIKEMDYLMRMQDEQEEERYKKLDEIIRKSQETRKENATVTEKGIISRFQNKLLHRRTT